jgi:glycosyltransferase involved in cell wall biosynthesis
MTTGFVGLGNDATHSHLEAQPLRLTYIGPLPPHGGGIAQHGANLTAALVARGHSVQRLSWRSPYPARLYPGELVDPTAEPAANVRYPLDWHRPHSWITAGRSARQGDALIIPWVTTVHGPAIWAAVRAAPGIPAVALVHNALPHERHLFDASMTGRILRRFDAAVVHATSVAEVLQDLVPNLPIEVVPHPPNLPLTASVLPPRPPLRVLIFGFVRAYKGVELGLDAVAELIRRGVKVELTIAGKFWEPVERWQADVLARRLDDHVVLDDRYIPDEDVAQLFASHHIVLAPYRSATQSGIVPLAQAAGRPVVATAIGGLVEAVEDGVAGRLAAPDSSELANAIADVAGDLERYAEGSRTAATEWTQVADVITRSVSAVTR